MYHQPIHSADPLANLELARARLVTARKAWQRDPAGKAGLYNAAQEAVRVAREAALRVGAVA